MSRVVRFHRLGGPEVLQIEEIPDRALKEGELRVRIEAIGLNRAEQMYRAGVYLQTPVLPSLRRGQASEGVDRSRSSCGLDGVRDGLRRAHRHRQDRQG